MRALRPLLALALVAMLAFAPAQAAHAGCPAERTTLTVHAIGAGGVYVVGAEVYQETNGHPGLQSAEGAECSADARVL